MFTLLWAGIVTVNILKPYREFSENENRYLEKFPSFTVEKLVNGKFMNSIDNYFNDHFVGRDSWIAAQSTLEYAQGKRENNGVYIGHGALFDKLDNFDIGNIRKNSAAIDEFAKRTGLRCRVMIVPSAGAVQSERLPFCAPVSDQRAGISEAYSQLNAASGIDLFPALGAKENEYIYYRTDHHWTTYGAYLAYREYCAAAALAAVDYNAKQVSDAFNGTLYSSSGVRFMKSDTVEAYESDAFAGIEIYDGEKKTFRGDIYFDEFLTAKDKYSYFLGQNRAVVTIRGNRKTEKKLLIFKDSYAHCFAPMLLEHYDEIALVDLRYANQGLSDIIDPMYFDEILFLYSIDSYACSTDIVKLNFAL